MRADAKVQNALKMARRGVEPGTLCRSRVLAVKLNALHDAGWSWATIAKGAGVAPSSAWRASRSPETMVRATTWQLLSEFAATVGS